MIPLTVPQVQRLLVRLLWQPTAPPEQVLHRSPWRQRHQARARRYHWRRRLRTHLLLAIYVRLSY